MTDKSLFNTVFANPKFIHLARQNTLDQVTSYMKASQTGLRHRAIDGSELERRSPPQPFIHDAKAIKHQIEDIHSQNAKWNLWLVIENISPLKISYELLAENPT